MNGNIFTIKPNGELVEMPESPYDSENLLQELLEKCPNLLAGDQINRLSPRRWLLIDREVEIPSQEGGNRVWSADHLFIDQDGIPTIVEVKRSSDTRIRREVVGQMLDYASHAVAYWPIEQLKSKFDNKYLDFDVYVDAVWKFFGDDFDPEMTPELFWEEVKNNLRMGKIRMVCIADEIPSELQRIVEFLNEQLDPAEVLAIEIKQYTKGEQKVLVPRVIGLTSNAQKKKSVKPNLVEQQNRLLNMAKDTGIFEIVNKLINHLTGHPSVGWINPNKRNYFTVASPANLALLIIGAEALDRKCYIEIFCANIARTKNISPEAVKKWIEDKFGKLNLSEEQPNLRSYLILLSNEQEAVLFLKEFDKFIKI